MSKLYEALLGGLRGPRHYDYAMPLLLQDLREEQKKALADMDELLEQIDKKMYTLVEASLEEHRGREDYTETQAIYFNSHDLDVQTWRSRVVDLVQRYQAIEQVLEALKEAQQTYAPQPERVTLSLEPMVAHKLVDILATRLHALFLRDEKTWEYSALLSVMDQLRIGLRLEDK